MTALLDSARYAAANAQVSTLYARLIAPDIWHQLLEAPDIGTLTALLQQTGCEFAAKNQDDEIDIAAIERRLWHRLARLSSAPAQLIAGAPHDLLVWYWRRFEIDDLKTVLRMVHYQEPGAAVEPAVADLDAPAQSFWRNLAESGSIAALAERLPAGPYQRTLQQAMPRYQREQSLFVLEASLDLAYGERLCELIDRLGSRDRREAESYLGFQLDTQNLLWAYRYRIFTHLSPEEILNYTLHHRQRVNVDVIRRIALGASLAEMVQTLWGNHLPNTAALHDLPERQALARLEIDCRRHLAQQAHRAQGGFPLHLGRLLAYLILIEAETQDLIAILEGKAFGWPAERIRPYLVGHGE